jgi:hypothetical protein
MVNPGPIGIVVALDGAQANLTLPLNKTRPWRGAASRSKLTVDPCERSTCPRGDRRRPAPRPGREDLGQLSLDHVVGISWGDHTRLADVSDLADRITEATRDERPREGGRRGHGGCSTPGSDRGSTQHHLTFRALAVRLLTQT